MKIRKLYKDLLFPDRVGQLVQINYLLDNHNLGVFYLHFPYIESFTPNRGCSSISVFSTAQKYTIYFDKITADGRGNSRYDIEFRNDIRAGTLTKEQIIEYFDEFLFWNFDNENASLFKIFLLHRTIIKLKKCVETI